jgi:hypothetical protein
MLQSLTRFEKNRRVKMLIMSVGLREAFLHGCLCLHTNGCVGLIRPPPPIPCFHPMDESTIKTPNPICQLFFKIDLLTDFAALRYIHSWFVFLTQLVNCCPPKPRNYTCVLLPLYLLSDFLPPTPKTVCGCVRGGGGVELCCRPYSDQIQNLQNCFTTPNKKDQ